MVTTNKDTKMFFHPKNYSPITGQITQWDLIFHGTDEPVQPNDPPRKPKSGLELSYGGELGHNSLEFDSDPASGMWRDMQQVSFVYVLNINGENCGIKNVRLT